jgi:hypothetical protein
MVVVVVVVAAWWVELVLGHEMTHHLSWAF